MNWRLHIGEEATTLARTDGPERFTLPLGASAGLPQDPGFAASLLILRELMHHLKFDALSWHSSPLEQGPP